jgi:RNA-directed DNA polymerase
MADLQARLATCGFEMHPTKTKIAYCKDNNRRGNYPNVSFDFLGYCFRPRRAENSRTKQVFCNFLPAVSQSALESTRATVREPSPPLGFVTKVLTATATFKPQL